MGCIFSVAGNVISSFHLSREHFVFPIFCHSERKKGKFIVEGERDLESERVNGERSECNEVQRSYIFSPPS